MLIRTLFMCCAIPLLAACGAPDRSPGDSSGNSSGDSSGINVRVDPSPAPVPGNPRATPMARALFSNLHALSGEYVLLAHQDALAYGMGWKGEPFRTDIHDVLGDHPAVFGWDLGHIDSLENIDGVPFSGMKRWAVAAYERGGINTYSWHMRNYATGGTSWDTGSCVQACLPGGALHEEYLGKLNRAADFFSGLENEDGEPIPVILRPFHEMNGGWFWWGNSSCTPGQYRELFRLTVDYLREEKGQHQLLIAFSTDVFETAEEYLTYYPGDRYVDIMGFDDYRGLSGKDRTHRTVTMLETLDSLSSAHGKLMTISETGVETIPDKNWFTGVVLPTLKQNASTRRASWILLWRNGRPDHFYAPYPGHPVVPDFIEFMEDPLMLSLSELPNMYQ